MRLNLLLGEERGRNHNEKNRDGATEEETMIRREWRLKTGASVKIDKKGTEKVIYWKDGEDDDGLIDNVKW